MAFENITGNYGYISEKIFDCFYAGVVPIYLGDDNISKYIPSEALVDARQFTTDLELLKYVRECPKSVWQKMYDSGQDYLQSESIKIFQSDRFVSRMIEIINEFLVSGLKQLKN